MSAADAASTGAAETSAAHQLVAFLVDGPGSPASRRGGIVCPAASAASRRAPDNAKNVAPRVNGFMGGSSEEIMRRPVSPVHLTGRTPFGRVRLLSFFGTPEQSRRGP